MILIVTVFQSVKSNIRPVNAFIMRLNSFFSEKSFWGDWNYTKLDDEVISIISLEIEFQ